VVPDACVVDTDAGLAVGTCVVPDACVVDTDAGWAVGTRGGAVDGNGLPVTPRGGAVVGVSGLPVTPLPMCPLCPQAWFTL